MKENPKCWILLLYRIYIAPTVCKALNKMTLHLHYNLVEEESEGPAHWSLQSRREGQLIQRVMAVGNELMEEIKQCIS